MPSIPQKNIKQLYQLCVAQPNQRFTDGHWSMEFGKSINGNDGAIHLYHWGTQILMVIVNTREAILFRGAYSTSDRNGINSLLYLMNLSAKYEAHIINGDLCLLRMY